MTRTRGNVLLASVAGFALCALLISFAHGAPAPGDADPRPYKDGPLSADDFRHPVPDPRPEKDSLRLRATTWTWVHYNTQHEWREVKKDTYVAKLTGIEVIATVERGKSWNHSPHDAKLLDHEQGHFDISELTARRALRKINGLIAGQGITGHGHDQASAIADLSRQVKAIMQGFFDQEDQEQAQYDRVTHHGTVPATQAEQRKKQRAELKELADAAAKPKSQ